MKNTSNNIQYSITGIHCPSCIILIEKLLSDIPHITATPIDTKNNTITIRFDSTAIRTKTEKIIQKILAKHGYTLSLYTPSSNNKQATQSGELHCAIPPHTKKDLNRWIQCIGIGIVLVLLRELGKDMFPSPNIFKGATLSTALVTGLIASVSSCMAITGVILLGLLRGYESAENNSKDTHKLHVHIGFHLGRVVGFTVLGGLLGLIGGTFQLSLTASSIINIVLGILIITMGGRMLGFFQSTRQRSNILPKSVQNWITHIHNPKYARLVGALTFLIPCGFTQSMQLLALSSGNVRLGAGIMGLFALGTLPMLFLLGIGSTYMKQRNMKFITMIIAVGLMLYGIFTLSNGWMLLGGSDIFINKQTLSADASDTNDDREYIAIQINHNGRGLDPQSTYLEAGKNYTITINPQADGIGCMSTLTIPKINSSVHQIKKGSAISYTINNAQAGSYPVICASMGMKQGEILVQ